MLSSVLIAVAVVNVITFAMFGIDKWKARRDVRRIPEAQLLWLSFATGLFGGWAAMSYFRHKTRKTSFRIKMVLVSVFNVAWLLGWLWYRGTLA